MPTIADAAEILAEARAILVFTGAGVSTDSGIPDFRGPDGVWTRMDPADFTITRYLERPEIRQRSWAARAASGVLDARPNAAHAAIARMWRAGRVVGCVTQNIDGLHTKAGLPAETVVELHGSAATTSCVECGTGMPTTEALERVRAGDPDPACEICGGILKADVVFFGEAMPLHEMMRAHDMTSRADACLAVGSTLSVFPAAGIPIEVVDRGKPLVIVNRGATELDAIADVVLDIGAAEGLVELCVELGI